MRLNLNCFLPQGGLHQHKQSLSGNSPQKSPSIPLHKSHSIPFHPDGQDTKWVSLGLPAAVAGCSTNPQVFPTSGLPDKIRHLGDILRSLDDSSKIFDIRKSTSRAFTGVSGVDCGYRKNWIDTDYPLLKDGVMETARSHQSSRLVSVRSTPRDMEQFDKSRFDLRGQLNKLEMLTPRRKKEDAETKDTQNLQLDILRDVLAKLRRIESLSRRRKQHSQKCNRRRIKYATPMKFTSFVSSIKGQMERLDGAVTKMERDLRTLVSKKTKKKEDSLGISVEDSSAWQTEFQHIMMSTDELQKQCEENKIDIKLCWSAMNQLCIDNETFRQELQYLKTFTKPAECFKVEKSHEEQASECGRWTCSGTLQ